MGMKEPSDFELLYMIHQKDDDSLKILLDRYKNTVWAIVHAMTPRPKPVGVDIDDLYQEGLIGVMDAINAFREDKDTLFGSFMRVCVERQISSYLRKTRSHSYRLLSRATSLDAPIYEEDDLTLMDTLSVDNKNMDPVYATHVIWAQDQIPLIKEGLPDLQWKVYHMHSLGYTYKEIADSVQLREKDVDNIIQKIKRKIRGLFDTE